MNNTVAGRDLERVIQAIPEGDLPRRDTFTTGAGIVFRVKPVPPMLIEDTRRRFLANEPQPPMVRNEDKETLEENPNDPEYRRAHDRFFLDLGEASSALMLTRGTELIKLPEGIEPPEGETWSEDVHDITGIEVPPVGSRRRYYVWLKYVALTTWGDFNGLVRAASRASGMTREDDVADAAESFRDNPPRAADTSVPPATENGLRH
jgi:hypothetical protein